MRGDFSRLTFRPDRHYSSVRLQQGRVQVDADWNEQVDIALHRDQTASGDVVGQAGTPLANAGFAIGMLVVPRRMSDAALTSATAGVAVGDDGTILTTADGGATWTRNASLPGLTAHLRSVAFASATAGVAVGDDGTVLASTDGGTTWVLQPGPSGLTADLRSVALTSATAGVAVGDDGTILTTADGGATWVMRTAPPELAIGPGRMYVDGVLVENDRPMALSAQPFLPGAQLPSADGRYLFYLDVWQRHLTAVERPELREIALGGPDTATRTETVWQVRWEAATGKTCADFGPDWIGQKQAGSGRLAGRATPTAPGTDPCEVPPGAGYRRLENQLYRVEVHDPSALGQATFKWSRDNGSVLANVASADTSGVMISGIEKDGVAGFGGAQFAEISDEERYLNGQPGDLIPVTVKGSLLSLGSGAVLAGLGTTPTARRWESAAVNLTTDAWLDLEDGVQIRFTAGDYRTGDWWTIPARTIPGTVDWPVDESGPQLQEPHGIERHYTALGVLDLAGATWTSIDDCRLIFPPLTGLTGLFEGGGDGQESLPGSPLPQEVRVWAPAAGSRIQFTASAAGAVAESPAAAGTAVANSLTVTSGPNRLAICGWKLDPNGPPSQTLAATLLDAAGQPFGVPVQFTANLSLAAQVAYDPAKCPGLAGVSTVQDAIDALCSTGDGEREPGIRLKTVLLRATGSELLNDSVVLVEELSKGIQADFDGLIEREAVDGKPVSFVTIELPYPLTPTDREFWGDPGPVAFQSLVLAAQLSGQENQLAWQPEGRTMAWLDRVLAMIRELEVGDRVLARLTIQGNFIWSPDDRELWVDGDSFGAPAGGRTDLQRDNEGMLSGDGRRGGDFRMWFWLARERIRRFGNFLLVPVVRSNLLATAAKRQLATRALGFALDRASATATLGEEFGLDPEGRFDLEQSRSLLAEAEIRDGRGLVATEPRLRPLAEMLAQSIGRAGLQLEVAEVDDLVEAGAQLFVGDRPADFVLASEADITALVAAAPRRLTLKQAVRM